MTKETVEVLAVAVRVVVLLEWGRKEEWGANDPIVFVCATERLTEHHLGTTRGTNIRHG